MHSSPLRLGAALAASLLLSSLACSGSDPDDTSEGPQGGKAAAGGAASGGKSGAGSGGSAVSGASGQSGGAQAGGAGAAGAGGAGAGGASGSAIGGQAGAGQGGSAGGASGAGGSEGGQGGEAGSGGEAGAGGDAGTGGNAGSGGSEAGGQAGSSGSTAGAAGSQGGGAGAGASGGAQGGGGGAPAADPCEGKAPVCPKAPAGFSEGDGLVAIDRCAFPMNEAPSWATFGPLVEALEKVAAPVKLGKVLADLNRNAVKVGSVPGSPPGVKAAFRWDSEDNDKAWWIPQGISGSADASEAGTVGGKRVIVVSWYHDVDKQPGATDKKGVRLAIVDATDLAKPTYRLVLLVEPTGTVAQPDFKAVNIHAGGIAWYGDYLYVADTGKGFRVFDTRRILQVATDADSIGCAGGTCRAGLYKYALPQVGAYNEASPCSLLFSWVSLDRSSSPPSLLSGEYCSGTACSGPLAGRILRWPLDPGTGLLTAPTSWPSAAYLMGQTQVQGGAARNGTFYLSSSAPAGGGGALYRVKPGKSKTSAWIDTPEDLMVDPQQQWLWSLSEGDGARYVFGAALSSYPPP